MFFYLLECSTVNSYILYKKACTEAEARPLTSIDFHRSTIDDLVHEHLESSNCQTVGCPRLRPTPIRLNKKLHLLNQRRTNRNCVVCSGERRHTTLYYCTTCPEEPALHPTTLWSSTSYRKLLDCWKLTAYCMYSSVPMSNHTAWTEAWRVTEKAPSS